MKQKMILKEYSTPIIKLIDINYLGVLCTSSIKKSEISNLEILEEEIW